MNSPLGEGCIVNNECDKKFPLEYEPVSDDLSGVRYKVCLLKGSDVAWTMIRDHVYLTLELFMLKASKSIKKGVKLVPVFRDDPDRRTLQIGWVHIIDRLVESR
jgi:hypothetical protein